MHLTRELRIARGFTARFYPIPLQVNLGVRPHPEISHVDPMELAATVLALGGLAVSAWSTWLVSRSRVQPLRDLLYARQADLGVELLSAASDFHTCVGAMIDAPRGNPQQAAIQSLVNERHRIQLN